ncbi:MAG: tetratricopeptide repeat protein [Gemmatimonadales bacterium]
MRASLAIRAGLLSAVLWLGCSDPTGDAIERGDLMLGEGKPEAAIAEYKLALRNRPDDPELLARLGHAYAASGQIDGTLRYYVPLLASDTSYRDQIAADLVAVARDALGRGSRANMVRALAPLLSNGAGDIPADLRLAQARYLREQGDYERALPLYLTVIDSDATEAGDVPPVAWFETARAFEELGACRESLDYFSEYLSRAPADAAETVSAQWHYGNCLYQVSERSWQDGRGGAALGYLDRLIDLGVPRTLLDRAHFLKGEALLAAGNETAALDEFLEVLQLNPTRSGPLVQLAEERVRELRYR